MPIGRGKYDELCTHVRHTANADGAVIIVIDGAKGSGFSVQATAEIQFKLPELLEAMAAEIRRSLQV